VNSFEEEDRLTTTHEYPTWGHAVADWHGAKVEARDALEKIAKTHRAPVHYGDLTRKIRSIIFEADGHDFHGLLGQLSEESDQEGKGMISALVVLKDDERPGKGFFTLAKELGRDVLDPDKCWIAELNRVYSAFGR